MNPTKKIFNFYNIINNACVEILQRKDLPLDSRVILLGIYLSKIDEFYNNDKLIEISSITNVVLYNADDFNFMFNLKIRRYDVAILLYAFFNNCIISDINLKKEKTLLSNAQSSLIKIFEDENSEDEKQIEFKTLQKNSDKVIIDCETFLENVILDLFTKGEYPISKNINAEIKFFENYIKFAWSYCYLKITLRGMVIDKSEINLDDLNNATVFFAKQIEKQKEGLNGIVNIVKGSEIDNMASIALLIKSS